MRRTAAKLADGRELIYFDEQPADRSFPDTRQLPPPPPTSQLRYDPLVDEWVVVLPSPDRPSVLAATDLRRSGAVDLERDFEYATSCDPEVVAACAELLAGTRAV